MSGQPANVVRMWRRRGVELARRGFKCAACGRLFLVKRLSCPACGSRRGFEETPLPARGRALALTNAGMSVEHLDQTIPRKAAVLLDLGAGSSVACLLSAHDAGAMDGLRGAELRLAVRKIPLGHLAADAPIPYGLKAAADLETRAAIRAAQEAPPADPAQKET